MNNRGTLVCSAAETTDYWQGDEPKWQKTYVEGKDFALLYDAGSQDDLHGGNENRVVAYIHRVRPDLTRLDYVILSHPHKDHVQLMPDVFAAFQIGDVWDSGRVNPTDGYCHFLKAVAVEPGVRYPAHPHQTAEDIFLLSGDLNIAGRHLRSGDFHHCDAGTSHPVNYSVEGCTLLAVLSLEHELTKFAMA